ncbi:MAG TPA: hypothetical protein VJ783_31070 [Pirellulales bacterium]|nr:hypothetical protein [Pirellulales bacterium]
MNALCEAEGKVAVDIFPRRLRSKAVKDLEVVERFLASQSTLVTTDHRLPLKQAQHIPDHHPGIIVVRNNGPHTQRERDIVEVLALFKACVPQWEQLTWLNSIVELYQDRAEVYSIKAGKPTRPVVAQFGDSDFLTLLSDALTANLQRGS